VKETKAEKTARLLRTGRLRVYSVTPSEIAAECKGDSGELYTLGWRDGHWRCSCKARVDCSHLNALWAVTAVARNQLQEHGRRDVRSQV
jgi:hypothetical protein